MDRETGAYEGTSFVDGVWILVNNLHKGRGTGAAWSWVIDLSAAVLLVCGVTGLWLLWYVKRRRWSGLARARRASRRARNDSEPRSDAVRRPG